MKKLSILILAALMFGGCTVIETSRQGDRTMVSVMNTGWYLFNFIPLASGDPSAPNSHNPIFFRKTVNLENNVKMLDYAMRKEGASGFREIVSHTTDETFLFILVKRHACYTSAELLYDVEPLWKTLP